MKCLDSKKFRADEIFKHLEKDMREKGYNKNWKQMQTRFKTLRQRYNQIKRKMGKSGSGNYLSSFPYATEMSELLDSRPIAIQEGIDSCVSKDSNNLTNQYMSEDSISISLNKKDDCNDHIYEDAPDPRDGAIPGCSKDINESPIATQCSQSNYILNSTETDHSSNNSSTSNSSNTNVKRQRYKSRSYETIVMKYADKMKDTFEKSQEKVLTETKDYVSQLIQSEKEIMDKMMENHRIMLNETTKQLLSGLQNIFGTAASTVTVNPSQIIPSIVPSFNEPYLYSNGELQHFQSPATLPKVLINLKRPVSENEETQRIKIQKLNNFNSINIRREEPTTKDTISIDINDKIQS